MTGRPTGYYRRFASWPFSVLNDPWGRFHGIPADNIAEDTRSAEMPTHSFRACVCARAFRLRITRESYQDLPCRIVGRHESTLSRSVTIKQRIDREYVAQLWAIIGWSVAQCDS